MAALAAVAIDSQFGATLSLDPELLAVTLVLCAAANLVEVFAPGHYSFQPNLVFFFWGALLLPPWAIALLAVVSYIPGWLKHRFRWYMVCFNIANYAVAGIAAHELGRLGGGLPEGGNVASIEGVLALVLAALAFVMLNIGLIVVAVSLSRHRTMGDCARDMSPSATLDVALAMTGACLAVLWHETPALALLATGPMLLVYRALWVPLLQHKSRTDPKTGLCNSEHLDRIFSDALAVARKRGTSLSVVMIDLDRLRNVNNSRGHLAGDLLLRATSDELLAVAGPQDTAARFGGDELCLLLPGRSLAVARSVAESLRNNVEQLTIPHDDGGPPLQMTISTGIASFPEHGETVNALLSAADAAVYDAKLDGRNKVRTALAPGTREALGLRGPAEAPAVEPTLRPVPAPPPPAPDPVTEEPEPDPEPEPEDAAPEPDAEPPRVLPWLVAALCLGAGVMALLSSTEEASRSPLLLGALVGAFIALDKIRIDVFERAKVSPASIPVLALAAAFGPIGPVAAEAGLAVLRALKREPGIKWTFDFGALSLAGGAAAAVFYAVPAGGTGLMLLVGALAGLAYYVVNVALLSSVMGIAERKSPLLAWRERLAWLWPHYLFSGMLAVLLVTLEADVGAYAIGVFAVPLLMVWLAQKQYLDRSRWSVAELRRSHEELAAKNERLEGLLNDNRELLARMHRSYLSTITSLARTIEAKDPYTGGHTERVAEVALALARELGFTKTELQAVKTGALIHDIGKIGVRDRVLLKKGPLTPEEFAEIREHPKVSSYIVADLELPAIVKQMVRNHHERFDGAGYPDGLMDEEIPLAARILSVADAFDAMTSDRPYRSALSLKEAQDEIQDKTGEQFCPRVVSALGHCLERDPDWVEDLHTATPQALDADLAASAHSG